VPDFDDQVLCKKSVDDLATTPLSAVASAAAVTAAATTVTAAAAATATATARWAGLARTGFIYRKGSAFHRFAIQLVDCVLRFLVRPHCDEGKAARFAGEFVLHEHDFLDSASLRKKLLQFVFGCVEGKISDV
jgi:hypothetical protein